jgi:DNA-binding winged helix-turn-helix (wHTH) protein
MMALKPDSERPRFFHTVRGIGYQFVSAGEESGS